MRTQAGERLALWLPNLWRRRTLLSYLLAPLAWLFAGLVWLRRGAYKLGWLSRVDIGVPVVVIGNITTGGAGKTPLVMATAHALVTAGFRPGIICRGYKGNSTVWPRLLDASTTVDEVGDEAVMMAAQGVCSVVAGPDRVASARLLAERHCNVIISDDGLQHYRLDRQVEVVVVNAQSGFGNRFMLPAGPLREGVHRLTSTDIITLVGRQPDASNFGMAAEQLRQLAGDVPVVSADYAQLSVLPLERALTQIMPITLDAFRRKLLHSTITDHPHNADSQPDPRIHAVAGVGHPERFFDALRRAGFDCVAHAFADHHPFARADFSFDQVLPILVTEKDAVKCRSLGLEDGWYVKAQFDVEPLYFEMLIDRIQQYDSPVK